jgi:hypothetical protein
MKCKIQDLTLRYDPEVQNSRPDPEVPDPEVQCNNGSIISAVGYRVGRIRNGDKPVVYWHKPEPKSFVDVGMSFAKEMIHGQAFH